MAIIAVLDSGVGGLSIYQEVVKKCPNHQYVFISDNEAFPYGTKSEEQLVKRVTLVVERIVAKYSPDILIVACNTASTVVLPLLRQQYKFPIVGVVPAIKPAAQLSKTKTIGLLATPGTISRPYTQHLIDEFANDCNVIKVGSCSLVEMAESKLRGSTINIEELGEELEAFINNQNVDTLVLACTHFPLLNNDLSYIFKLNCREVAFVDSGKAIANRVFTLCNNLNESESSGVAVFTSPNSSNTFEKYLTSIGLNKISLISV